MRVIAGYPFSKAARLRGVQRTLDHGGPVALVDAPALVAAEDLLVVEASLDNKDVGFILVGQRAEVKVDAFTFTRYGMVDGTVTALSRDAVLAPSERRDAGRTEGRENSDAEEAAAPKTPSYMARVALDRSWTDTERGEPRSGLG